MTDIVDFVVGFTCVAVSVLFGFATWAILGTYPWDDSNKGGKR